jgi:hypothetical protein
MLVLSYTLSMLHSLYKLCTTISRKYLHQLNLVQSVNTLHPLLSLHLLNLVLFCTTLKLYLYIYYIALPRTQHQN